KGQQSAAPGAGTRRGSGHAEAAEYEVLQVFSTLIGATAPVGRTFPVDDNLPEAGQDPAAPWVEVTASAHLADWLAEQQVSLAFTTYQSGKLFLLGRRPDGVLAVFERTFSRAMGLWADGQTLWLSTRYQIWRFENALRPGQEYQGHDRLYVPRVGYT